VVVVRLVVVVVVVVVLVVVIVVAVFGCYCYPLLVGWSGDRIPVPTRFFASVQTDPGAQPASYTMGTLLFPGVKRMGRVVDHTPPSSAEAKEKVEICLYSPFEPSWPVLC
jgi:hypothetical protein